MMDDNEKMEVPASCLFISKDKTDGLYPMYFGVSCAFVALKLLSGSEIDNRQWSETRDRMLQGSAHLLGLLVWRIQREEATKGRFELLQKLEKAQLEIAELKKMRTEDAKANEKVVGIFASQEQSWLSERKKLRQQIGALLSELRVVEMKKEEIILNLDGKLQEKELLIQSRDKALEEEERKRKEIEKKLQKAEDTAEELRMASKKEAQLHSSELWKHKTALIELVSNQRQLEAEMGRALRQVEAAKEELDSIYKQKEESMSMVQKLSMEVVKMHKDSDQKDKILSAMLRKSKLDTTEKQILLKEVKISKARRKQAELETERWRTLRESKHERQSSRSTFANQADSRLEIFSGFKGVQPIEAGSSRYRWTGLQPTDDRANPKTRLLEYLEAEHRNERDFLAPQRLVSAISECSDQCSPEGNGELTITTDVKQLEGWVRSETEKNTTMLEQRHHLEIDAFSEQLRLKDEKLEAFRWRLLSMELESKQLQSHIEGLDQNLSQLTEENMKLEALLLNQEAELKSLKENFITMQLNPSHCKKTNLNSSPKDLTIDQMPIWSDVKIIKMKPREEEEEEPKPNLVIIPQEMETRKEEENPFEDQSQDDSLTVQTREEDIQVEKEVAIDTGHVRKRCVSPEKVKVGNKLASVGQCLIKKDTTTKLDLHALGVSYNIKRLKQQLLLLDKLARMKKSEERGNEDDGLHGIKGLVVLMPLLNKQVSRYYSLQEKIDDLCRRMCDNDLGGRSVNSRIARTKEESKTLENFLEETFQLQRYMVATGQKLMEIHSRIASGFIEGVEEVSKSASFDMRRFAESVRTLFKEVQRGLEVRIARIIGDLEGTLACEGIIHLRN